jgi:small-conductance mechanosensitive channel
VDLHDVQMLRDHAFLGTGLDQWCLALAAALVSYLALTIGLRVVLNRVRAVARKSANTLDDGLVEVLASTRRWLFAVMALLIGLGLIELDSDWHRRVDQLWFIALALQFGLWGAKAISLFLDRYVQRHTAANAVHTSATATLMSWGLRSALWAIVVLAVLSNMGVNITAFVASLGVGGIAVALAVQNVLGDLFASLSIAVDKPFEVGDGVAVNGISGTIELVGLKSTRIRSSGGEQIVMSNTELLKQTISNYKRLQERRIVFKFGVTYDTTPEQAEQIPGIVEQIVKSSPKLRFDRAHLQALGDSSLDYEVVYFVQDPDYLLYMDEQQRVYLQLMRELDKLGVQFAFPTRTLHVASVAVDAGAKPRAANGAAACQA